MAICTRNGTLSKAYPELSIIHAFETHVCKVCNYSCHITKVVHDHGSATVGGWLRVTMVYDIHMRHVNVPVAEYPGNLWVNLCGFMTQTDFTHVCFLYKHVHTLQRLFHACCQPPFEDLHVYTYWFAYTCVYVNNMCIRARVNERGWPPQSPQAPSEGTGTWAITKSAHCTAALAMSTFTPKLQKPCLSGGDNCAARMHTYICFHNMVRAHSVRHTYTYIYICA